MLLPHYKRAEIALTDGNRRNNELAAERTGLFKQRDLMAALCSYDSCLAACYAAAASGVMHISSVIIRPNPPRAFLS